MTSSPIALTVVYQKKQNTQVIVFYMSNNLLLIYSIIIAIIFFFTLFRFYLLILSFQRKTWKIYFTSKALQKYPLDLKKQKLELRTLSLLLYWQKDFATALQASKFKTLPKSPPPLRHPVSSSSHHILDRFTQHAASHIWWEEFD